MKRRLCAGRASGCSWRLRARCACEQCVCKPCERGAAAALRRVKAEAMRAWSSSGSARELCLGMGGTGPTPSGCLLSLVRKRSRGAGDAAGWELLCLQGGSSRTPLPRPSQGLVGSRCCHLTPSVGITQPIPPSFLCQHLLQLPDFCFSLTKSRNCMAQPHLPQQLICPLVPSTSSSRESYFGCIRDLSTCGEAFPGQRQGLWGLCTPG